MSTMFDHGILPVHKAAETFVVALNDCVPSIRQLALRVLENIATKKMQMIALVLSP